MKVCPVCSLRFGSHGWHCPGCGESPDRYCGYLAFAPELAKIYGGFDTRLFERLAKTEPGNYWFESRNRLIIWALRRYFPSASDLLEIGCGTGFVLSGIRSCFPDLALSGSDIFSEGLSFAGARVPDAALFQMDARHIPFWEEFDVIGAFDVLEHIAEDAEVLSQMFQAVKPGGGILLTVPQHRFLWSASDDYAHHQRRYTRREIVDKVTRAGFGVVRATSFVSLLLPLMLLARIRPQAPQGECNLWEELNIAPSLNRLFTEILDFERSIIQKGFSFPVGGSLLLIAERR